MLSSNGLRDVEIINAKTSQAQTYENEASTLRELLQAQKDQLKSEKETNKEIISNLNHQIRNYKEENNALKQRYADELERIVQEGEREKDGYKNLYKNEASKLKNEIDHLGRKVETEQHLSKELTIVNDKLMKEQNNIRNRYQIDEIEKEAYVRGDLASAGPRQKDFLTNNGIPIVEGMTDQQLGEEYLARQRAWNDLDTASRDVQRNINKVGLITEMTTTEYAHYDLEKNQTPIDDLPEPSPSHPIRLDTYQGDNKMSTKNKRTPEKPVKKPTIDYAEIERLERERENKDRARQKTSEYLDSGRMNPSSGRSKYESSPKKTTEESKYTPSAPSAPTNTNKTSVLNPFAKKMGGSGGFSSTGGSKKLDPVPDKPKQTYGAYDGNKGNIKKTSSGEIDDAIEDNYDFNFGDKKQPSDESIKENVSEEYSGFEEDDPLEYAF